MSTNAPPLGDQAERGQRRIQPWQRRIGVAVHEQAQSQRTEDAERDVQHRCTARQRRNAHESIVIQMMQPAVPAIDKCSGKNALQQHIRIELGVEEHPRIERHRHQPYGPARWVASRGQPYGQGTDQRGDCFQPGHLRNPSAV